MYLCKVYFYTTCNLNLSPFQNVVFMEYVLDNNNNNNNNNRLIIIFCITIVDKQLPTIDATIDVYSRTQRTGSSTQAGLHTLKHNIRFSTGFTAFGSYHTRTLIRAPGYTTAYFKENLQLHKSPSAPPLAAKAISKWGGRLRRTAEEGFLGRGPLPPPHQLGGLGERCNLPCGVRGGAPTANAFWAHIGARKRGWWLQFANII